MGNNSSDLYTCFSFSKSPKGTACQPSSSFTAWSDDDNAAETDDKWERLTIETVTAGGGTEEDGRWFHHAIDSAGIVRAIEEGTFTATGSFPLYLTFARKHA